MHVHPETNPLDVLAARIAALEVRLAALERPAAIVAAPPKTLAEPAANTVSEVDSGATFTSVFSLFGAALLGIAGAYVLRAISGASLLPRGVVAGLAAVYATGWLLAAARSAAQRLAATLFAATSILILAPMLWEMSIRFEAMSATGAAIYLAAYAAIATALGFRSGFRSVRATAFTVAFCGSALVALALSIATHAMALFTLLLLAMYSVCELSPLRDRSQSVRVLVALCADASAWALVYVYTLPVSEQTGYAPLSSTAILCLASLLFAIPAVSVAIHTVRRAQRIDVFTILQVMISFALLLFTIAWFMPAHGRQAIGALCLLLAAAGYSAAYGPIRRAAIARNLSIFLVWSAALLLAADLLLGLPTVASLTLGLLALVSVPLASRMRARSIEVQGTAFLCVAAFTSGLLAYTAATLAGRMPDIPGWPMVLFACTGLLTYAVGSETRGEPFLSQILHLVQASIAACGVTALLTRGLAGLAALVVTPGVFHIAVLRTLALCLMAVALAWLGARLVRIEMVRVAYAALALAAVKLLLEDLRLGQMEFIAVSIFLVALTFLSVPRLARIPTLTKTDL